MFEKIKELENNINKIIELREESRILRKGSVKKCI
jgi:hypothetical protein